MQAQLRVPWRRRISEELLPSWLQLRCETGDGITSAPEHSTTAGVLLRATGERSRDHLPSSLAPWNGMISDAKIPSLEP